MFCLSVELLTGRYVATDYADRGLAEWPPHPARVFSALVATWAEDPDPQSEAALQWLEAQSPPALCASPASHRDVVTVFVPVNDTSVLGDLDKKTEPLREASAEVAALQGLLAPSKAQTKALEKATKALKAAESELNKALMAPAKVLDSDLASAQGLLPDGRKKMPRAFPSVTPQAPRFSLVWPDAEPDADTRAALDALCARVHRIGHSSSLVSLSCPTAAPAPSHRPQADGGLTLRVPEAGQLLRLQQEFEGHLGNQPRVMPCRFVRYGEVGAAAASEAPASVFGEDWIVLRRLSGDRRSLPATLSLARAVRGALLRHGGPTSELLSGHAADGAPSQRPHLAVVPLPFVGHPHADGELKGVALVLPRGTTEAERAPLWRALGAWEAASRGEGDADHPPLCVTLGAEGRMMLELIEAPGAVSLRPSTWTGPATEWVSVTPVVLDRFPGDLRQKASPARRAAAWAAAEEIVRCAIGRVGLPEPEAVELGLSPTLSGGRSCRDFPALQSHDRQRLHLHARLRFAAPVRGPILLGAGRYGGYGLFRPLGAGERS